MPLPPPTYPQLLRALTLGTARRELAPAVGEWLDRRDAIDPTADQSEYLLAAVGLAERLYRRNNLRLPSTDSTPSPTAPEDRPAPGPRLARGLQLILDGTYPTLLDEAVRLIHRRGTYVPYVLLPTFHLRAVALLDDYPRAQHYLAASGERGKWLARQHPDWQQLLPDYDYAAAYRREEQPATKARLLAQWRYHDPAAARDTLAKDWVTQSPRNQEVLLQGLRPKLSAEDRPWLREALAPKRKGVRRAIATLLLLAHKPEALADHRSMAKALYTERGFTTTLSDAALKERLATYGGVKAPQTLPQRLLEVLPPKEWTAITGKTLPAFWGSLNPLQLRNAARAVLSFGNEETVAALAHFVLFEQPAQFPEEVGSKLMQQLSSTIYDRLMDELLTAYPNALSLRSLPRQLALLRNVPWSERLTRAMVLQLTAPLRDRHLDYGIQRELSQQWKRAIPLVDVQLFPWLRQQLHTATERYDAFGKLATELLQTTAFRRELHRT